MKYTVLINSPIALDNGTPSDVSSSLDNCFSFLFCISFLILKQLQDKIYRTGLQRQETPTQFSVVVIVHSN